MARPKKKWVSFRGNTLVPAKVIGADRDKKMQAGKPEQLPASYADHVVSEGIAVHCDPPTKKKDAATAVRGGNQKTPNPSEEEALKNAKAQVAALDDKLKALPEDDPSREALQIERDAAASALTALETPE